MTNDNTNTNHEEQFIYSQLAGAREDVARWKQKEADAKTQRLIAENNLMVLENAAIAYMQGNGLEETSLFKLTTSESIDCPDINSVPDEFIRTKTIKEVNKAAIKAIRPQGANWYTVKQSTNLKVKESQ